MTARREALDELDVRSAEAGRYASEYVRRLTVLVKHRFQPPAVDGSYSAAEKRAVARRVKRGVRRAS